MDFPPFADTFDGIDILGFETARDESNGAVKHFRANTGVSFYKQQNTQENLEEEQQDTEDFFNVQTDEPRRVPMMVLKSNIQREKVRQNRFKLPERTHEELFREKVQTGPAIKNLYDNDDLIDVRGGDGTALIMRNFDGFVPALNKNIKEKGIERPTLVQKSVMPIILTKSGFDLLARAETGTGKTAAFLFPIIHLLEGSRLPTTTVSPFSPQAVVISPTRELAQQLGDTARTYCRGTSIRVVITYGEIPIPDTLADVAHGCDLLITTIGRLMQFANEKKLKLNRLRFLVLDEADKLILDSIFKQSVLKIRDLMYSHHKIQQTIDTDSPTLFPRILMFSATYGETENGVTDVLRAGFFCVTVGTNDQLVFASTVNQKLIEVESRQMKIDVLFDLLVQLQSDRISSSDGITWRRLKSKLVIFCNSRRITNWLALKLSLKRYMAIPINGDRTQKQRHSALAAFEHGDCDILVSTNVAARGLNLANGCKLVVVNFELPRLAEDYVHRIGRTGRAGNIGRALSFIDLSSLAEIRFRDKLIDSFVKLNKTPPKIITASL